jgi:hypothetical protein
VNRSWRAVATLVAPIVLLALGACTGSSSEATVAPTVATTTTVAAATTTSTTTLRTSTTTGSTTTTALPATTTPATTTPVTTAPATTTPVPTSTGPGLMPDVVCLNLQVAQDKIQQAGVFFSRSHDATGNGRLQILDRDWLVVAQTPAPGTPFGEGEAVLDVVKYGEPNSCPA